MMKQKLKSLFSHRSHERVFWIVFISTIVVTFVGGLILGLRQSMWFDESFSVLLATKSVGQLVHLTSIDVHPPLYYLLLKGWGSLFGWGDLAMRSLSVLFTAGALAVGGLLVRRMFNARVAIYAMVLVMLAPLITRYGFEVRMYSMASFIGISATYALYAAWKSKGVTQRRWLVLYAVLVAIGLWTLYTIALLWIAHVVWIAYMAWRRRSRVKQLVPYIVAYACAGIAFLPWMPVFKAQLTNGALGPIVEPLKLDQLIGVITFNTVYQPTAQVTVTQTAVLLAMMGVFIWAVRRAYRQLRKKPDETALLVMYMAVPIVVMMVVSLAKAMYVERYLSHVAIGMVLLGGVVLALAIDTLGRKKWPAYVAIIIVYGAMLVGIGNLISIGNYSFQHKYTPTAREVTESIGSCPKDAMLLADGPYVQEEIWYYMPHCDVYFTSSQDNLGGGFGPLNKSKLQIKDVDTLTAKHIIYISYGDPMHPLSSAYTKQDSRTYGSMDVVDYSRTTAQ